MTDPGHLARRAQLAVLLDRADRLTVDEAALLRTLLVAELAVGDDEVARLRRQLAEARQHADLTGIVLRANKAAAVEALERAEQAESMLAAR